MCGTATQAIADWSEALGTAAVCTDTPTLSGYQRNTSEFPARDLVAVLRPSSVDDVQRIVEIARRHGVPLHPISTGRNWGFGSALPVRESVALVDLGLMQRIVHVDPTFRYAVFEPGLTQGALSDHLLALGDQLKLNVTGAGRDTSIAGNVLDHGSGHLGPRIDDLLGVEAVLGNGEIIRTGLWHLNDGAGAAHHYPPGIGPDLLGLFVQSNIGIVTKMVLRLRPTNPWRELIVEFSTQHISTVTDVLRDACSDGITGETIRILDGSDQNITFFQHDEHTTWKAQIVLRGNSAMRLEAQHELERRLAHLADRFDGADTEDDAVQQHGTDRFRQIRAGLGAGVPSDRTLEGLAQRAGKTFPAGKEGIDHDRDLPGFLCVNVSVPFSGEYLTACLAEIDAAATSAGLHISHFFDRIGPNCLAGFFPFYFDRRRTEQVRRAHALKDDLLRRLEAIGIYPLRLDVDSMSSFIGRTDDSFWRSVTAIKRALDPQGIISPGRYCAL